VIPSQLLAAVPFEYLLSLTGQEAIKRKQVFPKQQHPPYNQPNITSPSPGGPAGVGNRGGGAFLPFQKLGRFSSSHLFRKQTRRFSS